MENKVYYGEYSLDYWIELILKKNIILPDYQRNFSWTEEKREKLITSLKNKEFVPPVIIGSFSKNKRKENLLIDGQQRLTSILLSVLGYFPDREAYKKFSKNIIKKFIDENDELDEDNRPTDVINWSFKDLLSEDNLTISKIKKDLEKNKFFKSLDNENEINDEFLKNTYLGFSYLVPSNNEKGSQQRYYSSVFRNINRQGISLTGQESREALYYLEESKKDFFKPKFIDTLKGELSIDYIRYLSILSQYKKEDGNQNLCNGYGGKKENLEIYYENYINFIINGTTNDSKISFMSYEELFDTSEKYPAGDKPHLVYYDKLQQIILETTLINETFDSIIDCDMYYFGLIYLIVFEKKDIDVDKWIELSNNLKKQISKYKMPYLDENNDPTNIYSESYKTHYHPKNPSALKYIRERVEKSIEIYEGFKKC